MGKKIDQRREAVGSQMVALTQKLAEWSKTNNPDVIRFKEFIQLLQSSNLKLLCRLVGKTFSPISEHIKNKNDQIFLNEQYITFINSEVFADSSESFDFSAIFNGEAQEEWEPKIHEAFWKRMGLIDQVYRLLAEVDPEMKLYSITEST